MKFDYISDIHFDLWIDSRTGKVLKQFIDKILPENPSKVLVIAGDISHYNSQTFKGIKYLKEFYEHIVIVHGNHDMWLLHKEQKEKYSYNSFNRLIDLYDRFRKLENVHYLNGDVVEIDGTTYGGCIGFYDGQYTVQKLKYNIEQVKIMYNDFSDSKFISNGTLPFDWLEYSKNQFEKMDNMVPIVDVMITHHMPIWEMVAWRFAQDPFSAFFYFDGYKYLKDMKNKVWIYGHTHDPYEYVCNDVQFLCNPLGYAYEYTTEHWTDYEKLPRIIKTFERD